MKDMFLWDGKLPRKRCRIPGNHLTRAASDAVKIQEVGQDFSGHPTTRFMLALVADNSRTQVLELSDKFDFSRPDMLAEVGVYLAEAATRLKNPRQDCYLTLHGLPLSFEKLT